MSAIKYDCHIFISKIDRDGNCYGKLLLSRNGKEMVSSHTWGSDWEHILSCKLKELEITTYSLLNLEVNHESK